MAAGSGQPPEVDRVLKAVTDKLDNMTEMTNRLGRRQDELINKVDGLNRNVVNSSWQIDDVSKKVDAVKAILKRSLDKMEEIEQAIKDLEDPQSDQSA